MVKLMSLSKSLFATISGAFVVKIKIVSLMAHKVISVTKTAIILRSIVNSLIGQILGFLSYLCNKVEKNVCGSAIEVFAF
jgi:hypothetical protein